MRRSNVSNIQKPTTGNAPSKRSRVQTTDQPCPNGSRSTSGSAMSKRSRVQTTNQSCENYVEDGLNSAIGTTTERTTTGVRISSRLQHQTANDQPLINVTTEEQNDNVMSASNQDPPTGPTKKVRGKTRGVNADKVLSQLNAKIPVTLTEQNGRPTGPYAEMLANEIGFTVRNHAPLNVEKWKKIPKIDVDKLVKRITNKFDIDMSLLWVERYVITTCQTVFCNFRYKLKKHFEKFSTIEEAIENKHDDVKTQEEWEFLCARFSSEKFQIRSEKNAINRSKLTHHHKAGSKSFMSHQEQIAAQTGEMQGAIDRFETEYKSTKKGWDLGAKAKWDEMIKMRTETTQPDGTQTMTDDEICAKVLGVKSGYIKGCGFGPRPPPSRVSHSSINEMSEKNKELQEQLQETQHLVGTQQQKIDAQNEVIQRLEEQAKKFEEFMANFSRQHPSS
ncbi:uncharacterized protein LOC112181265 [Rosa chinensis]|uniref:uncharacterized protein LOC112181265 n=1 Tax=Rosa chinensis TaxID=74649 RepID=UPI001AD90F56|nr:uncharacterized protein LOC112181265 [Rosa chinensis]